MWNNCWFPVLLTSPPPTKQKKTPARDWWNKILLLEYHISGRNLICYCFQSSRLASQIALLLHANTVRRFCREVRSDVALVHHTQVPDGSCALWSCSAKLPSLLQYTINFFSSSLCRLISVLLWRIVIGLGWVWPPHFNQAHHVHSNMAFFWGGCVPSRKNICTTSQLLIAKENNSEWL